MKKYLLLQIFIFIVNFQIYNCIKDIFFSPQEQQSFRLDDLTTHAVYLNEDTVLVGTQTLGIFNYNINENTVEQLANTDKNQLPIQRLYIFDSKHIFFLNADNGIGVIFNYIEDQDFQIKYFLEDEYVQHFQIYERDNNSKIIVISGKNKVFVSNIDIIEETLTIVNTFTMDLAYNNDFFIIDLKQWYIYIANKQYVRIYNLGQSLNEQQQDVNLICQKFYQEAIIQLVIADQDHLYIADTNKGLFYSNISYLYQYQNSINIQVDEQNISKILVIEKKQITSIAVTSDQTKILVGIRSRGIQVYDITESHEKPYLIQNINGGGYAINIILQENLGSLIFCNGETIKLYKQIQPNLSVDFPNLFNAQQSTLVNLEIEFAEKTPWRVKISSDNLYVYIAAARNGLLTYDISNPSQPQLIHRIPCTSQSNPTDGVQLSFDNNILFMGEGGGGVKILDVRDKSNIFELSHIDVNGDSDDIQLTKDVSKMVIANGNSGVSVVDISDKTQPREISKWSNQGSIGSTENVLINRNETYIFASLRYYGFLVLDFLGVQQEIQELEEISVFRTGMCEQIILNFNETYAFLSDGTYGISIVDIKEITNMQLIKSVSLKGFPAKMRLINYSQKYDYLLISQRDQELLAAVNITDIYNPELVIKYSQENEEAYDVECLTDNSFCYLVSNVGLRVIKMQNSIDIHTQFLELVEHENAISKIPLGTNYLPVGKDIQVQLVPYKAGGGINIKSIYYYDDAYQLADIPNYMSFSKGNLILNITVDKDGIKAGKTIQSNILLIELVKYIDEDAFFHNGFITMSDSNLVKEKCMDLGYISRLGYLNDRFDPDIKLFTDPLYNSDGDNIFTEQNQLFITQKLQQTKIQVPLILNFVDSLTFNPHLQGEEVITSESNFLKVQINIENQEYAEFVQISYPGALVDKYLFMMEGTKEVVLQTLTSSLLTQIYNHQKELINIKIQIDDQLNHLQVHNSNYLECQFLQKHKGVSLGSSSLNEQFTQSFTNNEIYITREFVFQFSDQTFLSPTGLPLDITILLSEDNLNFFEVPYDHWVQVSPVDSRIKGNPSTEWYGEIISIKIIANDGYSEIEDQFTIKINKIPFELFVYYILAIGSPLMTLVGFYSFRGYIWGIFCKKRYKYGTFYIEDGQEFRMQMNLSLEPMRQFRPIYKKFLQYLKQKQINIDTFYSIEENKINNDLLVRLFMSFWQSIKGKDKKLLNRNINYFEKEIKYFQKEHTFYYDILKYHLIKSIVEQQKQHKNVYDRIVKVLKIQTDNQNSWYLNLLHVECNDVVDPQNNHCIYSFYRDKLFDILLNCCEFKNLQQMKQKVKELKQNKEFKYSNNDDSRRQSIEQLSQQIRQSLKVSTIKVQKPKTFETKEFYNIYEETFIKQIQIFQQNLKDKNINIMLVLWNILGHAHGLSGYKWFQYAVGESLHCDIRDINIVKALIKDDNGCFGLIKYFPSIFKFFNLDYTLIPMVSNSPLPNWLNYQFHNNIIELRGFWDLNEDDEFLIRIESREELTMKEIVLKRLKKRQAVPKHKTAFISHTTKIFNSNDLSSVSQSSEENAVTSIKKGNNKMKLANSNVLSQFNNKNSSNNKQNNKNVDNVLAFSINDKSSKLYQDKQDEIKENVENMKSQQSLNNNNVQTSSTKNGNGTNQNINNAFENTHIQVDIYGNDIEQNNQINVNNDIEEDQTDCDYNEDVIENGMSLENTRRQFMNHSQNNSVNYNNFSFSQNQQKNKNNYLENNVQNIDDIIIQDKQKVNNKQVNNLKSENCINKKINSTQEIQEDIVSNSKDIKQYNNNDNNNLNIQNLNNQNNDHQKINIMIDKQQQQNQQGQRCENENSENEEDDDYEDLQADIFDQNVNNNYQQVQQGSQLQNNIQNINQNNAGYQNTEKEFNYNINPDEELETQQQTKNMLESNQEQNLKKKI